MINNKMSQNSNKIPEKTEIKKPDESAGFYFSSSIKIFDPNSKEIILHKRGDD